jgi:hypothetical protein
LRNYGHRNSALELEAFAPSLFKLIRNNRSDTLFELALEQSRVHAPPLFRGLEALGKDAFTREVEAAATHLRLAIQVRPETVSFPIHAWWAKETVARNDEYDWLRLTTQCDTSSRYVEGDHFSLLSAHNATAIAEKIQLLLMPSKA